MQMAVEKLDSPIFSYIFQGIFNTQSKLTIYTSGQLQSLRSFVVNFAYSHKEAEMINFHQNFCLDTFVLKATYG